MKGFGIEIKNDLLEKKHVENIGSAIWLYMWFIDKMTSINEDGIGKVLGGKPIKFPEVNKDLGIDSRRYTRWLSILKQHGYITAIRTPYGFSIRVNKAFKRFGKRYDKSAESNRSDKSAESNKTVSVDKKQRMKTPTAFSSSKATRSRMDDIVPTDEDGNELPQRKKRAAGAEGQNKIAIRIRAKFGELCKKYIGIMPVADIKGYKMVLYALNTGGLTEPQIMDLFDEWFKMGKSDEETVQITRALSTNQINGYKVRNNIKS